MKTVELLNNLLDVVATNRLSLTEFPISDLKQCILSETECRKELYTKQQYSNVKNDLNDLFDVLQDAIAKEDLNLFMHYFEMLIFAIQITPDADYAIKYIEQKNYSEAMLRHYKNNTIIVLGDSHTNFFSGNELISYVPMGHEINTYNITDSQIPFTPLHLGPALAYNCMNYNTTTRFREKVDFLTENFIRPNSKIICTLGEIDVRVHVLKQANKRQMSYMSIIDEIVENYVSFMKMLKEKSYLVYCWGPIASQNDSCPYDEDFPRFGSETERNKATEYFNNQLKESCEQNDIGFMTIFDKMITDDYYTIQQYLSEDHVHLSQSAKNIAKSEFEKMSVHPT